MNVVSASRLSQRFGSQLALGPLDLEVATGERLAVLGDNGAGKTTLLRLIATAARPSSGRLRLFGLDAGGQRERLRGRLGYLGHQPGIYAELSVRENLEFFAVLQGVSGDRVAEAIDECELGPVARAGAGTLSRGLQQRLALARSVLHHPELLILDEPDASLDASGRALLGRLFAGRTVIMSTHDRSLARGLCSSVLLLRAGRPAGDPWALRVMDGH